MEYCGLELLSDRAADAQTIYRNIGQWQRDFMSYAIAITKQKMYSPNRAMSDTNLARLQLLQNDKKIDKDSDINVLRMTATVRDWNQQAITETQLNFILQKLGDGKKLNNEFYILLDAYYNLSTGDEKAAVLYGGLAIESLMVQRLKKAIPTRNISKHTLGMLFSDLSAIETFPSTDWKEKIVAFRNDVIHGNIKTISGRDATQFLQEVETYLRWAYPNEIV